MRAIVFLIAVSAWGQVTSIPALVNPSGGAIGGASAVAAGQVLYGVSPGVAGSEAAFIYDPVNNRLSINTGTFDQTLFVNGTTRIGTSLYLSSGASNATIAQANNLPLNFETNSTTRAVISAGGNLLLGTTTDGNFRLDIGSSGSAGTLRAYDQTATTGVTQFLVRAGAANGLTPFTNAPLQVQDNGGTTYFRVSPVGKVILGTSGTGSPLLRDNGVHLQLLLANETNGAFITATRYKSESTGIFGFTASSDPAAALDASLSRASASVIQSGDGGANANGDMAYRQWIGTARAFAALGTPANGTFVFCSDCTIANPCASGGTGAFAKRLNSVWVCN